MNLLDTSIRINIYIINSNITCDTNSFSSFLMLSFQNRSFYSETKALIEEAYLQG
jgi:hypothetical protein